MGGIVSDRVLLAAGLGLLALSVALLPLPVVGLAGFPAGFLGLVFVGYGTVAAGAGGRSGRDVGGSALVAAGVVALAPIVWSAAEFGHRFVLPPRPGSTAAAATGADWALQVLGWAVPATMVAAGELLRERWSPREAAVRWAAMAAVVPVGFAILRGLAMVLPTRA
jgi:hypothetical protein